MTQFWGEMGYDAELMDMETRHKTARDLALGLFMEVYELTDSFAWKPWRQISRPDTANLEREIVDCLFFLHHLAECFGIDAEDLANRYVKVMANNRKRYIDKDFSDEDTGPVDSKEKIDSILSKLQGGSK